MINKVKNVINYRSKVLKNIWIRKVKFCNIKSSLIKKLAIRSYIYEGMKKKYSKVVKVNNTKSPVNKTKKIWICWFQGRESAPALVKRCIETAEKKFKGYEVIVLTWDNYKNYVSLPNFIMEKYKKGVISIVHLSDLIRLNVLINHGGLWIDSTVLCTCNGLPDYMKDRSLFVYQDVDLDRSDKNPTVASNWLIYSGCNNNILMATRDMLYEFWKRESFLNDYFIFHILFRIATEIYEDEWKEMPVYNNINPHMLQFELENEYNSTRWNQLLNMSDFHKLSRHLRVNGDKFTNYDYILNNFKEKK